jgi:hypothetical protein
MFKKAHYLIHPTQARQTHLSSGKAAGIFGYVPPILPLLADGAYMEYVSTTRN